MTSKTLKRIVAAGAAAIVLGGVAIGLAYAQAGPTPPTPAPGVGQQAPSPEHQRFLDAVAARLGISTQRLEEAIDAARSDAGLPAEGEGYGHGDHHGGVALGIAAQAIGITPQELRQELPGKSLAQVAAAHGKDPALVAAALKNAANARIDQEVAAGELTPDQATQRKLAVDSAIDQDMTRVWPAEGSAPASPVPAAPTTAPMLAPTTAPMVTPTVAPTTAPTGGS
jgi:hypothetical protein